MSVKQYLAEQYQCTVDDVGVLRQMVERLHAGVLGGDTRTGTMARSISAYALNVAARIEHAAAYAAGHNAAVRDAAPRGPDVEQLARRRRPTTRRGQQPFEYLIGAQWMTQAEIAARVGISRDAVGTRILRGADPLAPRQAFGGRPSRTATV